MFSLPRGLLRGCLPPIFSAGISNTSPKITAQNVYRLIEILNEYRMPLNKEFLLSAFKNAQGIEELSEIIGLRYNNTEHKAGWTWKTELNEATQITNGENNGTTPQNSIDMQTYLKAEQRSFA